MSVATALKIYRVLAWVTGLGLLLLTFYAMPAKYFFDDPGPVAVIGQIHGFLYLIYVLSTLVLAERARWKPVYAVLIMLAGTIPIASFVAERKVTKKVHAEHLTAAGA